MQQEQRIPSVHALGQLPQPHEEEESTWPLSQSSLMPRTSPEQLLSQEAISGSSRQHAQAWEEAGDHHGPHFTQKETEAASSPLAGAWISMLEWGQ